jgi:uncharacterized membrane protein
MKALLGVTGVSTRAASAAIQTARKLARTSRLRHHLFTEFAATERAPERKGLARMGTPKWARRNGRAGMGAAEIRRTILDGFR